MEEFLLKWNNELIARIQREPNGTIYIIINESRFRFAGDDPRLEEKFLGVLNVVTYYRARGGFDLHLPNQDVLYGIDVAYIIHFVVTYLPTCPVRAAEFRNRILRECAK